MLLVEITNWSVTGLKQLKKERYYTRFAKKTQSEDVAYHCL